MANLFRHITGRTEDRTSLPVNFQDWVTYFNFQGTNYPLAGMHQTLLGEHREFGSDYQGLASEACRGNSVVFACMAVRLLHFAQARFQFQQIRNGRPGNLFGTTELAVLENPWPNGTTGDLLARMIQHVDLAGNAYVVRDRDRLAVLRPDWVDIMLGSRSNRAAWVAGDGDTEVLGYAYWPGGRHQGTDPLIYSPFEIAHMAPQPDPEATYRGMSWLTPLVREIQGDTAMTDHKNRFLANGATVNLVVKFATPNEDDFNRAVSKFRETHEGTANAYKTLLLGAGTDVQPVGTDLAQMDFSNVQAAGEGRIAMAARVPQVILGSREGLQGSSLNSGNFNSNRRMFADGCIFPLWQFACSALATIVNVPAGSRLWYDGRDIPFLQEDVKDAAEVMKLNAEAASSYFMAGWDPDAIIDTIASGDVTRLAGAHTGTESVQVQGAGSQNGSANNGSPPVPAQSAE